MKEKAIQFAIEFVLFVICALMGFVRHLCFWSPLLLIVYLCNTTLVSAACIGISVAFIPTFVGLFSAFVLIHFAATGDISLNDSKEKDLAEKVSEAVSEFPSFNENNYVPAN